MNNKYKIVLLLFSITSFLPVFASKPHSDLPVRGSEGTYVTQNIYNPLPHTDINNTLRTNCVPTNVNRIENFHNNIFWQLPSEKSLKEWNECVQAGTIPNVSTDQFKDLDNATYHRPRIHPDHRQIAQKLLLAINLQYPEFRVSQKLLSYDEMLLEQEEVEKIVALNRKLAINRQHPEFRVSQKPLSYDQMLLEQEEVEQIVALNRK